MKRIKLTDRKLPVYSVPEELTNTLTHSLGAVGAVIGLILCLGKVIQPTAQLACAVYCLSMLAVYTISTVYHGLPPGTAKKVLQILDHCTIYTLIAGTYTPIAVLAFTPYCPAAGWGMLAFQWLCAGICIVLNAIDLKKYRVVSMIAYIFMGWAVVFVLPVALQTISRQGLLILLSGGISYTLGAILYGIGAKRAWFHSIFHIFVVLGSVLHFVFIYHYVL